MVPAILAAVGVAAALIFEGCSLSGRTRSKEGKNDDPQEGDRIPADVIERSTRTIACHAEISQDFFESDSSIRESLTFQTESFVHVALSRLLCKKGTHGGDSLHGLTDGYDFAAKPYDGSRGCDEYGDARIVIGLAPSRQGWATPSEVVRACLSEGPFKGMLMEGWLASWSMFTCDNNTSWKRLPNGDAVNVGEVDR